MRYNALEHQLEAFVSQQLVIVFKYGGLRGLGCKPGVIKRCQLSQAQVGSTQLHKPEH